MFQRVRTTILLALLFQFVTATSFAQPRQPRPTPTLPPTPTAPSTQSPGGGVNLISISPSADRIDEQFPSAPQGISTFYFSGIKGTRYVAIFSSPSNPATVVGVGANIDSTSFDETLNQLTVNFSFDQSVIPPIGKSFPAKAFLLAINPGVVRTFTPLPRPPGGKPPGRQQLIEAVTECYGPLGTVPSTDRPGPPREAAGSFMYTNAADWCEIPPNAEAPIFGFQLRAPKGKTAFVKKYIPPRLLQLMGTLSNRTLDKDSLAIYNGDFESSKSITTTPEGGVLIDIKAKFDADSSVIGPRSSAFTKSVSVKGSGTTKTITTSEEEDLSLAPKSSRVTGTKVLLYGFVDDPTLAGQVVTVYKQIGDTNIAVGTAILQADGSYTTKIKSSKLFGKASSKSQTFALKTVNLVSTIVTNSIRTSRTITLANRLRDSRR